MAKLEKRVRGNFDEIENRLHQAILEGSMSATYEDGSNWRLEGVRCAVRVYERYSYMGGNRVSMSLTLVGAGDEVCITAITSGGSQAMFFKVNTWGEEPFWIPSPRC